MIAAAIVCVAAFAQAAQIKWGGAIATTDASDTLPAGTQAWLVYSATAFSGTATKADSFALGSAVDNGGSIVDSYTLSAVDSGSWSFNDYYTDTEAGGYANLNGYYGLLIQNPSDAKMASWVELGQATGVDGKTGTIDLTINNGWAADPGPYATQGGWTVAAVPEPTSGLLVILGMAGLALRRRRA